MAPWDTTRLFAPPTVRFLEKNGPIRSIRFPNEPYRGKPSSVFAYLGVPGSATRDEPVPGMVCVHGGGGRAYEKWVRQWVQRGYAAISMDLAGHGPDERPLPNGGPAQFQAAKFATDAPWEDMWTYHAVAAVLRAHGILRAQDGVDRDRIGITGISWGGYLTCIAAGIDPRFRCAVPVYGCGFLQRGSAEGWMELFAQMAPARRRWWHEHCDPSMYLPEARCPMLFVSGTNDQAYPLPILRDSAALPRGPVSLCIRVGMPHGHEAGWAPREIELFADEHLRSGRPLPRIGAPGRDGDRVWAAVKPEAPLAHARLVYTPDRGPWTGRTWVETGAPVEGGRVRATLPAAATAYYLGIEDDRGAFVSCPHEELAVPAKGRA